MKGLILIKRSKSSFFYQMYKQHPYKRYTNIVAVHGAETNAAALLCANEVSLHQTAVKCI